MRIKTAECGPCMGPEKFESQGANHILHFLLTVVTGGLWVLIWGGKSYKAATQWNCSRCGGALRVPRFRALKFLGKLVGYPLAAGVSLLLLALVANQVL